MKCPTCFCVLPEEVQTLSCTGPCVPTTSASLNREFGGHDVPLKPVFAAASGECPECGTPSDSEACGRCHSVVPVQWRAHPDTAVTCIAMIGARTSGKSLYLAVLKQQLELWVEEVVGSTLELLGDSERHYQQRYGSSLYESRRILPATVELAKDPEGHQPLIFMFRQTPERRRILVMRDVAGEDLEDLGRRRESMAFIGRADAVIVLIDPIRVPELRDSLHGVLNLGEVGGDGVEVVRQVVNLITEDGRRPAPPDLRMAVALSKADVVQRVKDVQGAGLRAIMVRSGTPLQRDPSTRSAGFDLDESDLLDAEIDSLLQFLLGPKLKNLLGENGVNHRYFAVSALGAQPDGERINAAGIAPFRVLDPVKWIIK